MNISQAARQGGVSPLTGQPVSADQLNRELNQIAANAQRDARQAQADAQAARHRVTITQDGKTTVIEGGGAGAGGIVGGVPMPPTPPSGFTPVVDGGGGWNGADMIPSQVVDIAYGFFVMCAVMVVGWPIARAFGRRLERKGAVAALPPGTTEQLQRIEQAVEAMAIEVERISESQRFIARLQKSSTAEPV